MVEISLPHNWEPRDYQMPLWSFLENGGKRAVAVWHRRAGKDATALNFTVTSAVQRVGLYWHLLPTYSQGRKIVWDGITREGKPFLSAWPQDLIGNVNNTDMKLELVNGSMWQVVGTDYVDRLVGANPVGCVFSEYSLQDPKAWELIRPILLENGGWALFVYTPRGKNHGHKLFKLAEQNSPKWFSQILTVVDTGQISEKDIDEERKSGMSEELIKQEFYCSFEAGIVGSYFTQQLLAARRENRIRPSMPIYSDLPVNTYWDLGMDDSTAVWFAQDVGREIHLIDYLENSGEGLPYYVREIARKPYIYGNHYAPFDIKVRELGSGRSRKDTAKKLGINFEVAKKIQHKEDGIEACRNIFPHCYFHAKNCARGIDALENFRKEWDDRRSVFLNTPVRDWSCHGSDAFQTMALTHQFKNMRIGNNVLYHPGFRRTRAADSVAGY